MKFRRRLFEIIEPAKDGDAVSRAYDIFIIVFIFISIMPLFFKESYPAFFYIEIFSTAVFIVDYLLRWYTADLKLHKRKASFFLYPVTPWAVIDLLAIVPAFGLLSPAFVLLRILRVIRVFKGLRYSESFDLIAAVIKKNKNILLALLLLTGAYIAGSALLVFNIEPDTFDSYFDAIYWAATAITTIGYGDIYPLSVGGKIIGMLSALFGVGVIALPTAVLTAGFMHELQLRKRRECEKP